MTSLQQILLDTQRNKKLQPIRRKKEKAQEINRNRPKMAQTLDLLVDFKPTVLSGVSNQFF